MIWKMKFGMSFLSFYKALFTQTVLITEIHVRIILSKTLMDVETVHARALLRRNKILMSIDQSGMQLLMSTTYM